MGDYMNMSLDAIIALNKIDVGNHRNSNDVNRNTYVNRNMKDKFERPSRDCNDRGSSLSPRMSSRTSTRQITKNLISIKFLISNELSGSMIGPGGAAIKELMDTTSARASVSASWETFPGTSDRIMLITGKPEEVIVAQSLVWDNVALHASEEGFDSRVMWSPRKSFQRQLEGTYDNLVITGKVTIPAAAIGLIIGRSGATIRSFSDRSGASVQLTEKGNMDQTDERVLAIAGPKKSCSDCITMIIEKLVEGGSEFSQYTEDHHMNIMSNPSSSRTQGRRQEKISPKSGSSSTSRRVTLTDDRSLSPAGRTRDVWEERESFRESDRDWEQSHAPELDREIRSIYRDRDQEVNRGAVRRNERENRDVKYCTDRDRDPERTSNFSYISEHRRALLPNNFHDCPPHDPCASRSDSTYNDSRTSAHNSPQRSTYSTQSSAASSIHSSVSSHSMNNNGNSYSTSDNRRLAAPPAIDTSAVMGADYTKNKIQRIVKGSRKNTQSGIVLRTKAQDKSLKDTTGSGIVEVLSANTTINVAVPDALIGSIFGKQSATLHEIIFLSNAHVVVSPRGQYIEGSTNRLVTITGSPNNAQTAHAMVTRALEVGAAAAARDA